MMKSIRRGFGLCGAKRDNPSPGLTANFFSQITLWWMNGHMWRGFMRPLEPTDIYTVLPTERSARRVLKLERAWENLSAEKQEERNSLLKVTVQTNLTPIAAGIFLLFIGEVCKFMQPFMIAEIVAYIKGKSEMETHAARAYSAGMVLLMILYSIVSSYGVYLGQVVAMRMRSSCTALIAKKAIRLSSKGMLSGQVVNLLATDVEKFYYAASEFNGLFLGPAVLLALLLLMAYELGVSILPALTFVIILTTVKIFMGNGTAKLRLKLAQWTDKRILFVTEIVSSLRTIKAYCWEEFVEKSAYNLRKEEINKVGKVVFLNGINLNLGHSCDRVVTFLLVLTFVVTDHNVSYTLAVEILTWMKMAQLGFLNFPMGYSMWKQMEASVSRMQNFLLTEEFIGFKKLHKEACHVYKAHEVEITLKGVSASWIPHDRSHSAAQNMIKKHLLTSISTISLVAKQDKFIATGSFSLRKISLSAKMGQLIGLIGPVGSGKTSLLLTILGNLPIGAGTRKVKGRLAYVPQQHWLRSNSIRDNILMGEKMDRKKYSCVLGACALQKDIAEMEIGDATKVNAKGLSLSRGQCARISLARAVYKDADIYILDDPFSSLDSSVASHIFHECIKKLLKNKLVLMTTNNFHFLKYTDSVLVLKEGRTLTYGKFSDVNEKVHLGDLLNEPPLNPLDEQETADVFAKRDKQNLLMPLFYTNHIKRECAHIPEKRATPFHVYVKYWKAGYGAVLLTLYCLLLTAQQVFSILAEWWLVYTLCGGSKKKYYPESKDYNQTYYTRDQGSGSLSTMVTEALVNLTSAGTAWSTSGSMVSQTTAAWTPSNTTLMTDLVNTTAITFMSVSGVSDMTSPVPDAPPGGAAEINQRALLGTYAIYVLLSVTMGILSVFAGTAFFVLASKNLYNSMFLKILYAPLKALASDKAGEIVNRLARDTGRMDDIIPITINATFLTTAIILTHAAYICIFNHYVVLATLPFLLCVCLFVGYCLPAIRDTKRLESEFRTPTFDHLQQMLQGLDVIRAFGIENQMTKEADEHLDRHTAAWHAYIAGIYWMKMRLNWTVTAYLAVVLLITLASDNKESMATPLGLSLAYIIVFMSRIQYFATNSAMLDANMTSVEHVTEYSEIDQETRMSPDARVIPHGWPLKGDVSFSGVSMGYPKSKAKALQNVSFHVDGGEKIGIVGRTGAGKSSIFNVFLRLYNYTGSIKVDGIDIGQVCLQDLRSNITFILQEPMLHSGTLRSNLDPYNKYSDEQVWTALEKVLLKKKVKGLPGQLDMNIVHDGANFSGGQKQLVCMARALLTMNKIMILDEVTADVDKGTARHICKMLHADFTGCTILHITHDIGSLMRCDRILVVGHGNVHEYEHPHTLLSDKSTQFHAMVVNLGEQKMLRASAVAKDGYLKKYKLNPELDKSHKDEINKALNEQPLFELREAESGHDLSMDEEEELVEEEDENAKDEAMEKSFEEKHRVQHDRDQDNGASDHGTVTDSSSGHVSDSVNRQQQITHGYHNEGFESEA